VIDSSKFIYNCAHFQLTTPFQPQYIDSHDTIYPISINVDGLC